MHARAQKLAVTFPGKENGEAHKAAMKTTPAFTPPLHPSAPEVTDAGRHCRHCACFT